MKLSNVYLVEYVDDYGKKHLATVREKESIRFYEERFGYVSWTRTSRYIRKED